MRRLVAGERRAVAGGEAACVASSMRFSSFMSIAALEVDAAASALELGEHGVYVAPRPRLKPANSSIDPLLVHGGHRREHLRGPAASAARSRRGGRRDAASRATRPSLLELVGDARDVAAGHHQAARQLAHLHAVGCAVELRHSRSAAAWCRTRRAGGSRISASICVVQASSRSHSLQRLMMLVDDPRLRGRAASRRRAATLLRVVLTSLLRPRSRSPAR